MAGKMAILKAPNCGCQTVRDYKNWADLQNGQIGCEIGHFGCNQTPPKPFSRLFQDFIKTLLRLFNTRTLGERKKSWKT